MRTNPLLCSLTLVLGAACASTAPVQAPAHAPKQHACAAPAAAGPQAPIAPASVNGRPEVRYYVIGDAWPFCQKIVAAVSELRDVHGEKVEFVVVPAAETARRQAEIERYNLVARKHGLVAFDAAGEAVMSISGHNFGKPEIEMAVMQVAKP